jgi:hypothetical protein
VGDPKPGATVLAIDPTADVLEGSNTLLAIQRYGKGRSMAFTTASSWRWQMLMASEDRSHERFWQQMIRWLALSSPEQVTVTLNKDSYTEREPVTIAAQVVNERYEPVINASVVAQVTGPTGQTEAVDLEWSFGDDGAYRAEYHPKIGGMHHVDVSVRTPGTITARDQAGFSVAESAAEYTNPTLHADVLTRLASVTDGAYLPIDRAQELPDLITPVKQISSMVIERDLRDTPLLFAAVLLLLSFEWFLRRQRGLA